MNRCDCRRVDEKEERLSKVLEEYMSEPGSLIPALQEAQKIYGYLSEDVLKTVASRLKIPVAKVFGVATFYSQFRLQSIGENVIRVCMGTACHVRGALKILRTIERELQVKAGETTGDGRFTLETVNCIGACGLAPVLTINDKVYGNLTPEKTKEILDQFE